MRIYNTRLKKIEEFKPIRDDKSVGLYTCGPTVYHFAHIGNLRTYLFEDILKKTLERNGFNVMHVMNITDVGHLQSDADEGTDKMNIAAKREKTDPWQIALFYEKAFMKDCQMLAIAKPDIVCRATEHIHEMIEFVLELEKKGFTYNVDNNIYFDISKFSNYRDFACSKIKHTKDNSRVEFDPRKKNQQDFVLWFSVSKYPDQIMKWDSPWGSGFPGWHIECSAMATKYLGEQFDIHCGGIDHIPIHHTNEIAQSEAVTGKTPWVNYWMHGAFLEDTAGKISKSKGSFLCLETLIEKGFEPLHYRYFCLTGHYRKPLKFSFDALIQSRNDFEKLKMCVIGLRSSIEDESKLPTDIHEEEKIKFQISFEMALADDLNTSQALSILWKVVNHKTLSPSCKLELLADFDIALNLGINEFKAPKLTPTLHKFIRAREIIRQRAKDTNNFDLILAADKIRSAFRKGDIYLEDKTDGKTVWANKKPLIESNEIPKEVKKA